MKKSSVNMLQGSLLPSIISFAVPLMLTSLLQLLFNSADMIIVGQFRGSAALAAVGATTLLTKLVINMFIGISVGVGVVVAQSVGSGDWQATHRAVHTALPTAFLSGAFLSFIGIAFSKQFLIWMDTPEEILSLSTQYMQIYFGGMVFNMVYNFSAAILRALGDSKKPLRFLTIAGVLNVILNVIFVTLFNMNVEGVALATTISQGISSILVVLTLMRRTDAGKLELHKMRFYKREVLQIAKIGIPSGIQSCLFQFSNVISQSSINSFGQEAISGVAAARDIEGFVKVANIAFYQSCMNFVGQNAGARQYKRILKIFGICLACAVTITLGLCLLMYAFGVPLLSIYITDSPEAIRFGLIHMGIIGLYFFVSGLMDVSTGALRGLGVSLMPMIFSILGVCVFRIAWIMTIFQIPQYHTLESLFWAYPISWLITFVAQTLAFFIVYRKRVRKHNQLSEV